MTETLKIEPEQVKALLSTMMKGWMIRENSWDPASASYKKEEEDAMIEAGASDQRLASLLVLFSYWSNDIQSVAAEYGIGLINDEVVDLPPQPDPSWWWDTQENKWCAPFPEYEVKDVQS